MSRNVDTEHAYDDDSDVDNDSNDNEINNNSSSNNKNNDKDKNGVLMRDMKQRSSTGRSGGGGGGGERRDSSGVRLKRKFPFKAVLLACALFSVGSVLLSIAIWLLTQHKPVPDNAVPLLVLGSITFVPGNEIRFFSLCDFGFCVVC